jgi:predicted aspartyl protease
MGRIVKSIEIEGQPAVALFDTGATYTYVRSPFLTKIPRRAIAKPARTVLGGQTIEIAEQCLINGKIEGLDFFTYAVPVTKLGAADSYELDAVIGALTLEQWQIRLDPKTGTLDLEGLRRREVIEF